jgi:hypothetical protein
MIAGQRLYLLKPWMVRALIPSNLAGAYVLYRDGRPVYAGRSDRNLQGRLVTHARGRRAPHFSFAVYPDPARAYDMECALYHSLHPDLTNLIHPASPAGSDRECPVCGFREVLEFRELVAETCATSSQVTPLITSNTGGVPAVGGHPNQSRRIN